LLHFVCDQPGRICQQWRGSAPSAAATQCSPQQILDALPSQLRDNGAETLYAFWCEPGEFFRRMPGASIGKGLESFSTFGCRVRRGAASSAVQNIFEKLCSAAKISIRHPGRRTMLNVEELLEQLVKALAPATDSSLYCWVPSVFLYGFVSKYMVFVRMWQALCGMFLFAWCLIEVQVFPVIENLISFFEIGNCSHAQEATATRKSLEEELGQEWRATWLTMAGTGCERSLTTSVWMFCDSFAQKRASQFVMGHGDSSKKSCWSHCPRHWHQLLTHGSSLLDMKCLWRQ